LDRGFQQGELAIWTVPASLLLLFGVRGLAGYVSQIGLSRITNEGLLSMRKAMFERILNARMEIFESQSSSALSNTVVYEVQTGATMLVNSLLSLTRNGLTLMALTGYLLFLNWKLTMIVAAIFPAVAWVMRTLTRRLHRLTKANQEATDALAYVVEENVLAHREIRLYGAQTAQKDRFDKLGNGMQRLALKSTVAGAAMTPMTQMLAAVALSAVISVALIQSSSSGTSVGEFVAFVTAMLMIVAPIRQLSEVSSPITRGLAALERGLSLIEDVESESGGAFEFERSSGAIDYQDVSVRYKDSSKFAVQSIDLTIHPGETVALVGASGSGKTTLANLLPRFINIESGKLLLDGHDVREWSIHSLRRQFAYVSQNVVMLNDTIAANVALGAPMDRARITECLELSNLASFIESAGNGIDTLVGHNALQLSGGQRQRLAIARALYKDAPILIMDEATSALDSESERAIQDSLNVLMRNRTTLVIAHRLSTIQHADRIVVLADGGIAEVGSHAELIAREGHYSRLNKASQLSGEVYIN
jgi:subfamily B ATP-binding cassette protein MsbA